MAKQAGKHDFDRLTSYIWGLPSASTFSVGIFEWVPAKSGGLKRSKAKVRVRGSSSDVNAINAKAREVADQLDAGTYDGPKTVVV